VLDKDSFTKKLLRNFIQKTEGITEVSNGDLAEADVVFIDAALYDGDYLARIKQSAYIVVVSGNNSFISALFSKKISDFLPKSKMNYEMFAVSMARIKKMAVA